MSCYEEPTKSYQSYLAKKWLLLALSLVLLLLVAGLSVTAGSADLTLIDVLKTLFGYGTEQTNAILWNVRLPRAATAIVIGFGLSICGCILQNVLRNPMASASTLGISQGASFGAAVGIVFFGGGIQVGNTTANFSVTNPTVVSLFAFLGGMITTLVILLLSRMRRASPATMVLAGVALSSIFTGMTTIIQYFVDEVKLASLVYWTFGSLTKAGWVEIGMMAVVSVLAFFFFLAHRLHYNAMEAGHATAKSLGVPVDFLVFASLILCALVTSVCVAFAGSIAFIGLIAPHIMRKLMGNDYRFLLPASALGGSILLLLSDIASRSLLPPAVLPIGALTSFLGAPLFLYLCMRGGKKL